jgi:hypothetical protein
MLREAQIPLVLWISAAALVHVGGGQGVKKISDVVAESKELLAYSRAVRTVVRPKEIRIELEPEAVEDPSLVNPTDPVVAISAPEPELARAEPEPVAALPEPVVEEQPKPEVPKPEAEEPPAPEPAPTDKPQLLQLPPPDARIAVKQHVAKDQPDNPNAPRIADDANHTDEETMARIRAYDQDSPNPSPGTANPGPGAEPGNASVNQTGFATASERPGETRPGADQGDDKPRPPPAPAERPPALPAGQQSPGGGRPAQLPRPGEQGREGRAASGSSGVDAITGADGDYSLDPSTGGETSAQTGRTGRAPMIAVPGRPGPLGLGQPGPYNLPLTGVADAIGHEHLEHEREQARNARLSRHRGAFSGMDFQAYRAAIENYDPSVKPGNQTSLNAARVPFARYINAAHNRIHPIFADGFLGSLDKLPRGDKLNEKLVTHLEVVLDATRGTIVRRGITKPSGVTAFDVAALK